MELYSLKGKTAVVIGGSKGLGKGIAYGLAGVGADVVLVSRHQDELDAAAKEISEKTKSNVIGISADIKSINGINALIKKITEKCKQIDILFNGAGINVRKSALDFQEEDWDAVHDVQLKYVFFTCQAVAKHMIENEIEGKIINIASLSSILGIKNIIAYCTAKGAIVQMTKALANELAQYKINVNAIGPGYYKTDMTSVLFEDPEFVNRTLSRIPMNRTGAPNDLMGAAVFLASEASAYVTGQTIYVDGGYLIS